MRTLTLIPEAASYGIILLVAYCLASFSLSAHIYSRWLAARGVPFLVVHCFVLGLISGWGFMIIDPRHILGTSPSGWVLALPVGIGSGAIAVWSDRAIIRHLSRRHLVRGQRFSRRSPGIDRNRFREAHGVVRVRPVSATTQPAKSHSINPRGRNYLPGSGEVLQSGLSSIVVVAILEELLFRGLLVQACFLLPTDLLIAAALSMSVVMFALSHVSFGWPHVIGKLPLGAIAIIGVLTLGTILPAIIAHVLFNVRVWRDQISQPVFAGRS